MAYSEDLRQRVLKVLAAGSTQAEAARQFMVSKRTVQLWVRNGVARRKPGPKGATKVTRAVLEQILEHRCDAQQKEIAHTLGVHKSTVCVAMKRYKISRKKNVGLRGKK
jgi:transposase